METELYYAIQALITLIEKTDFTRQVTVKLDLGAGMIGYILLAVLLSLCLGFSIGTRKGREEK